MEVHLWRGSPEQRALRDQSRPTGQFAYFDIQLGHPNWEGKSVLDYGGNRGNLLLNPDCVIRHEQYYCMDVLQGAIDEGRERFPKARWVHYNRYNCSFNPEGIEGLPVPDLGIRFDFILAFSVFTHTTREELHDLVGQLRSRLAPGGTLAFTFIDPHFRSWPETHAANNLQWRLERFRETNRSLDVDVLLVRSLGAAWCALVDGRQIFVNSSGAWENEAQTCMTYDVFYTAKFLQREFPEAEILPPVKGRCSTAVSSAVVHSPMHNLISTRVTQFAYFDQLLGGPAWKGRKVLDFGGNIGTFLVGAGDRVDHDDYWCIDLNREVIERGRQSYPRAHFVHYDRYSSQYNPNGISYLPIPDCGFKFDIIVAFSVFTHTHQSEMFELVKQLRGMLSPAGVLAFTFTDANYDRSLSDPELPAGSDVRKMLERNRVKNTSRDIDQIVQRAREARWCLLIDEELHVEPGDEFSHQQRRGQPDESYCTYYSVDYMASLFPDAQVYPPVSPEWQHCCLFWRTV